MTAIDAYADCETQALAQQVMTVPCGQYGFDAHRLLATIESLPQEKYCAVLYGSGLEANPDLLEKIARRFPLLGNTPEILREVKRAKTFFTGLQQCEISFPEVRWALPNRTDEKKWLIKHEAGCGGDHVRWALQGKLLEPGCYYQQYIDGDSVSILFLANGHSVKVIGFNEQWIRQHEAGDFVYAGAVNQADFSPAVKQQLIVAAEKVTRYFDLRGLNSLDAIVKGEIVYVLEVNPRLSATVGLYQEAMPELLVWHIQACAGGILPEVGIRQGRAKASKVVYATSATSIADNVVWPEWVTDTPHATTREMVPGTPICSVLAVGETSEQAAKLATKRHAEVRKLLCQ